MEEVRAFLQKAKMGVGTADSELPAEFCGAMLESEAALGVLVDQLGRIGARGRGRGISGRCVWSGTACGAGPSGAPGKSWLRRGSMACG